MRRPGMVRRAITSQGDSEGFRKGGELTCRFQDLECDENWVVSVFRSRGLRSHLVDNLFEAEDLNRTGADELGRSHCRIRAS